MKTIVLISHAVKDYDAWRAAYETHRPSHVAAGVEEVFVARDAATPNLVHVGFFAPSREAAKAFVGDPELKTTMQAAGVLGPPDVRMGDVG